MVVWEITLATAYFLGLKRTYKLALKIQRRLIKPSHPKLRQFAHRRTRAVFDIALKVHYKIQQRDIEVGRNLGNWILRWLDRMKPSAQIRVSSSGKPPTPGTATSTTAMPKQVTNSSHHKTNGIQGSTMRGVDRETGRHLFTSPANIRPKIFPTIGMIMRTPRPVGTNAQYRHFSVNGHEALRPSFGRSSFEGVIRKDIMQWLLRN